MLISSISIFLVSICSNQKIIWHVNKRKKCQKLHSFGFIASPNDHVSKNLCPNTTLPKHGNTEVKIMLPFESHCVESMNESQRRLGYLLKNLTQLSHQLLCTSYCNISYCLLVRFSTTLNCERYVLHFKSVVIINSGLEYLVCDILYFIISKLLFHSQLCQCHCTSLCIIFVSIPT